MVTGAFAVREDWHGGGGMGGANGIAEAAGQREGKRFHDIRVAALDHMTIHNSNGYRSMTQKPITRRLKEDRTECLA